MNQTTKQSADLSIVKFTRSKLTAAIEATPRQSGFFERGRLLGALTAEHDIAWEDELRAAKPDTNDRVMLRAGFIETNAVLCERRAVSKAKAKGKALSKKFDAVVSAGNAFDYLARKFAKPETSRQATANTAKRAKGGGRKEKQDATKTTMSEKTMARNIVACMAFIAKAQAAHMGDDETLKTLGSIAAILSRK